MNWTAVLFDFDGTIAYTAKDVWRSVQVGFQSEGLILPKSYSDDDRNLAVLVEDMVAALYPESAQSQRARIAQTVSDHYRYVTTYPTTVLYDGIEELLQALKARGIPTGILSNKGQYSLGRLLQLKKWDRYFDRYRGSRDEDDSTVDKKKRLAAFASNFDMSNGVYIGDSAGDVEAAKVNGIRSVGVLYGDGDQALVRKAQPDQLCNSPAELREYLMDEVKPC